MLSYFAWKAGKSDFGYFFIFFPITTFEVCPKEFGICVPRCRLLPTIPLMVFFAQRGPAASSPADMDDRDTDGD